MKSFSNENETLHFFLRKFWASYMLNLAKIWNKRALSTGEPV